MGDTHRLSRTLNHQGMTALALNQITEAQDTFRTALTLAQNGGLILIAHRCAGEKDLNEIVGQLMTQGLDR